LKTTISLTQQEWNEVLSKLRAKYSNKPSVLLIRSKMREELGFTVRHHSEWIKDGANLVDLVESIKLDFYQEDALTWFRLTFL